MSLIQANLLPNLSFNHFQTSTYLVGVGNLPCRVGFRKSRKKLPSYSCIRCEKNDEIKKDEENKDEVIDYVTVERPPYYSYMDSTSGQLEPASGARASIPEVEYWPEGTVEQVRAARAPTPMGESLGSPSYGSNPGSRRKSYRTSVSGSSSEGNVEGNVELDDPGLPEVLVEPQEDSEEFTSDYVVYQSEPEEEETEYKLDKKFGAPHPFIDPKIKKPIEGTLTSEELWWNWRKPEKEQWSRWQRRRPDTETVFLKAMAETGQVKLYGEEPTLTETALYRARRHLYKEERLEAEQEKLERIGPIAYYSEWVKAWKRDTSHEAIQKHFEETGEDETTQLIEMFSNQTDREYRVMMGTDVRIRRDPLAMRMREDQIKQIWGGDPVYPTVNYIQDPDEVIDYRGADFHEPTPNMLPFLKEHGKIISREELEKILEKQKTEQVEMTDIDEAMAKAVDIGENDDEEDSDVDVEEVVGEGEEEEEVEAEGDEEEDESKIDRNWSVLKTTPQLRKSKPKPKKEGPMTLDEAVGDSENLTDFLLDFEEE
ncbi:hypothetical protein MtrunA17_Chr2g0285501 [Medicago truncatula]|uniref:Plastid transcriptionally active protein n=2 Tax=Medicago truncatula TaxID=3880 RepID=G7IP39_MEDTR|nr:protein PLASTID TRANSCRIPTIONALLY ACTIVE 12, chloroplastic [Medicago truncatula]AES64124.1 plastid transcriptionally active protein [Medicago truncatula]RHN72236.1 hypothetical protein MtrunA17_Chr2g0285501 [Medicago truncatula]